MKKDELAKFLHESRVAAQMTQGEVARLLGYTTSQFISNWERGISSPPITVISTLSGLYKVSEPQLFELMLKCSLERVENSMREEYHSTRQAK